MLHEEEVGLAYDAILGPDGGNVAEWQETAIAVVDEDRRAGDTS